MLGHPDVESIDFVHLIMIVLEAAERATQMCYTRGTKANIYYNYYVNNCDKD